MPVFWVELYSIREKYNIFVVLSRVTNEIINIGAVAKMRNWGKVRTDGNIEFMEKQLLK